MTLLGSSIKTDLKNLAKKRSKEMKTVQKLNKKKRKTGNRNPSGFVKPAPISKQLADFLEVPYETELSRTDVTRKINLYVKENNLKNPVKGQGRFILVDTKLSDLFKLGPDDQLSFFNLQKYLTMHFPKAVVV
jgi:chromatin remodeling complex protein RSC6